MTTHSTISKAASQDSILSTLVYDLSPRVSIIIPAWNEENRIYGNLLRYLNYFSKKYGDRFELIVITDGCTDGTSTIVDKFSKNFTGVTHLSYPLRMGKGGSIRAGFKLAKGDVIAFVDADGAVPPEELDKLVQVAMKYDGAIGSRWIRGARVLREQPLTRKIASRGFNLLVRLLFGLYFKDTQCGAKAFRRYVIEDVTGELGLSNMAFDVELLYRIVRRGYEVKEVPITWMHREGSKLKLRRTIFTMLISLIGLRIKMSPLIRLIPERLITLIYHRLRY